MSFVLFNEIGYLKEHNPLDTNEVAKIVSSFHQDQLMPYKAITVDTHTHTHTHTHTLCSIKQFCTAFCMEILYFVSIFNCSAVTLIIYISNKSTN